MQNTAPAFHILREAGFAFTPLFYEYRLGGGTWDAANQLGLDEHRVIKSLVFDNGLADAARVGVMALMHGDGRVSIRKLERLSCVSRLAPSSPEAAAALSGYQPGGICPFGLKNSLTIYIQQTLLDLDMVYINAGVRGAMAAVNPAVFVMLKPVYGEFKSNRDNRGRSRDSSG